VLLAESMRLSRLGSFGKFQPLARQFSIPRALAVRVRLIPEREFNSIPDSKFVVDDAEVVLDDMLSRANGVCDFAVLEPLRDQSDNSKLSFVRSAVSVAIPSKHACLPQKPGQGASSPKSRKGETYRTRFGSSLVDYGIVCKCEVRAMPRLELAQAIEKFARAAEQAGMSVDDVIRILNAGVSVETLLDLIGRLQARSADTRFSRWIM